MQRLRTPLSAQSAYISKGERERTADLIIDMCDLVNSLSASDAVMTQLTNDQKEKIGHLRILLREFTDEPRVETNGLFGEEDA